MASGQTAIRTLRRMVRAAGFRKSAAQNERDMWSATMDEVNKPVSMRKSTPKQNES